MLWNACYGPMRGLTFTAKPDDLWVGAPEPMWYKERTGTWRLFSDLLMNDVRFGFQSQNWLLEGFKLEVCYMRTCISRGLALGFCSSVTQLPASVSENGKYIIGLGDWHPQIYRNKHYSSRATDIRDFWLGCLRPWSLQLGRSWDLVQQPGPTGFLLWLVKKSLDCHMRLFALSCLLCFHCPHHFYPSCPLSLWLLMAFPFLAAATPLWMVLLPSLPVTSVAHSTKVKDQSQVRRDHLNWRGPESV